MLAERTVRAGGLDFACLEAGEGPLALLLHGFPDSARTWEATLPLLAAAGWRAVAPWTRGYAPTGVPADGDYSPRTLAGDVARLIEALGYDRAVVIGHDWGAFAGYLAANLHPERVRALVTMAVPHAGALARNLSPAQARRSWYVAFFQLRRIAERRARRDDFAFLEHLWRDWSPGWAFTPEDIAPTIAALTPPGALEAALGYYRHSLGPAALLDGAARRAAFGSIAPPALCFAGVDDGCIGVETFAGSERHFRGPFGLVCVPGAGHFLHRERPAAFHDRLLSFLDALAQPRGACPADRWRAVSSRGTRR